MRRRSFATHYHELTQLADLLPGVRNYNVAVSEADGKVVFLHKILPGGADRSYGIHVGQLAGLPGPVVQRAGEILHQLEISSGKAVRLNPDAPRQLALFPETNPLRDELQSLDINALSPIEALKRSTNGRCATWIRTKFGARMPAAFAEQARQGRFLQQRGFSTEHIRRLFRERDE